MTNTPEPITRVANLLSTFRPAWSLCGGWAVDAWLGRQTREHGDLDISVPHGDQRAIFEHLDGWLLNGHDDATPTTTEPWDGHLLEHPAHIHAYAGDGFHLEVVLDEHTGGEWVLSRAPRLAVQLDHVTRPSVWGVPTVAPEILLFYKATAYFDMEQYNDKRPHDELDFLALLPHLGPDHRRWLHEAIALVRPAHPWLAHVAI